MKWNKWIKKYSTPCMWVACGCTVAAIVAEKIQPGVWITVLYVSGTILAGFPIAVKAIQSLKFKTVSIELLVTIAVAGAFIIHEYSEAAIVTCLFQVGTYLESKTMQKTRSAIKELTAMAPKTAIRITDDEPEEIDIDEVEIDDILLVRTGSQIPVDGYVVSGTGYADQASITGESRPIARSTGDFVYGGTILQSGTLRMRASRVGEDTTFSKIIALVEEAQDAKSPVERFIDSFAKWYTPAVIVLSALVLVFTKNLDTAITVLVLACPGALVIGAPIASVAGIGKAAQNGILLKGGDSLVTFAKTDVFLFDKTGTLTNGYPVVDEYIEYEPDSLRYAVSLESCSDHPLAKAITTYGKESTVIPVDDADTEKGKGMHGTVNGKTVLVGSLKYMTEQHAELTGQMVSDAKRLSSEGCSLVFCSVDQKITGLFGIRDTMKESAKDCIRELRKHVNTVRMLTGDNADTAAIVAEELGLDGYDAELLPEQKLNLLKDLQKQGHIVTFVGDGINDSPALAIADSAIAIGSGTDVAIECSDVVLVSSDLRKIVMSYRLANQTVRIMYENIAIAIAAVLFLLTGLFAGFIHMGIGMLVHEGSIMVVILNAMRLLLYKEK
ncbi:MAG: cation-translocating P-type ATPase [Erysipelotrichaceae bacterium]|nr:cation-translocating P-type ATPase [Erysipelotrichaceae bacterium]